MYILGISSFYHDSAASLIRSGKVEFAVEEERFSRIKHDNAFPYSAIEHCLAIKGLSINELDSIAYYEKPLLKLERILTNFVHNYPNSLNSFVKGMPQILSEKIKVEHIVRKKLGFKGKIHFIPHHLSHASSAYYTSPFKNAAIATLDGVGEYDTTCLWKAEDRTLTPLKAIQFPDSLGLLYSTFTAFLGFRINEDEYKLMGLAAYGRPSYVEKIYKLVDLKSDGSYRLNMEYFGFQKGDKMFTKKFIEIFGKERLAFESFTKRHKDIAASIQLVTEDIYFKILNHLYLLTNSDNLCVGGGLGLNALANGKIYTKTPFKNVWIFGASGDSGGAIGAGLLAYYQICKKPRRRQAVNLYLGSEYSNTAIETALKEYNLSYAKYAQESELIEESVNLLIRNKILGWFQGRMEFGPRALGTRSILANPRLPGMKEKVNKVKIRELFRPFAGIVPQEKVHEMFEVPHENHYSPFMNFCFPVKKAKQSQVAAIVHKDKTCRVQTITSSNGKIFYLLKQFYKKTGNPCLLNTSFNLKGEPIVESPKQAIEDFVNSKMDYLVIGQFLVGKSKLDNKR